MAASRLTLRQLSLVILGVVVGYLLGAQEREIENYPKSSDLYIRRMSAEEGEREVHVGTMCRCKTGALPIPAPMAEDAEDTSIVQEPSLATGKSPKRFLMHGPEDGGCTCHEDHPEGPTSTDKYLQKMKRRCPNPIHDPNYDWNAMPDLAVEQSLPLFVGVLSYESPLSLQSTLRNWRDNDFFQKVNARGAFVQLNHKSEMDDTVMEEFEESFSVMGSPEENLHPGLVISKMCRAAEIHPNSHPNGENLLMFLEKDWHIGATDTDLPALFHGVNSLMQRGVPYVRLSQQVNKLTSDWQCPSEGVGFTCTTAHNHRWTNLPSVISCKWFLRYLEPYALLKDPIMHGCRTGMQEGEYCDWEEAMQDGRIAWANSQWVIANLDYKLFEHVEVDS
mmetsp:Transcript_14489/g.31427  ORF Transcript_14489/g.31427 Transcript_14489/m.31427 type:complete len:391 (-) Transcript_14489:207-1379(-)|eukprot:CAMPEP_0172304058 /NCGR_PEP_ID=MMETSP1058-20130122/5512_1 /TAXON_ID=83371 /ORGANISM="Detonula confervacea, Strain CCMP 353" /LENGTH=390 /DNA_ID=CAMNT_0013015125 /DNA_START=60 /DNA_END=1232 /DNA_ORIENTATION=+